MKYLITYETIGQSGYPKTIIIDDLPSWLRDNPKCYVIMCAHIGETSLNKKVFSKHLNTR